MDDDRSADDDRLSLKLITSHDLSVGKVRPRPALLLIPGAGGSLKFEKSESTTTTITEPSLTLGLPCSTDAGYSAGPSYSSPRDSMASSLAGGHAKGEIVADEEELLDGAGARKKLRLNKEQSALLEDKFKEHATLNPKQKEALAKQLKLRPRQVEVWFQNRRARTKMKKTEVELEFLRKWCEALKEDNRRLHRELKELKSKQPPPAMCPTCKKVDSSVAGGGHVAAVKPQPQYLFSYPFSHSSAACM
ncbi:homeobox-leucine zipper protein HAT22-like [Curcuma longa]|uniref:homeobox-leucine zipper protein HAT22-like n=1 Tax=Curcuma longa TaxID=136217 RepID=UPI003D9E4484